MPLVGRDEILAELLTLISRGPETGSGLTILLQGEAGMGKTRLLDEVATRVSSSESPQWIVLRGSCSPFDDLLSYGPFYDAFQTAAPGDLTDMLMVEHTNGPDDAGNIRWRVLQTLRLLAQGGPLLLAIDDLHWANSATLHLFGFLATRIRTLPVLLVGTIQHPEAIPAVQRLLAVSRHRGEVRPLTVPPLRLEAVTAFLSLGTLTPTPCSLYQNGYRIDRGKSVHSGRDAGAATGGCRAEPGRLRLAPGCGPLAAAAGDVYFARDHS